jgi:hypothetical protein
MDTQKFLISIYHMVMTAPAYNLTCTTGNYSSCHLGPGVEACESFLTLYIRPTLSRDWIAIRMSIVCCHDFCCDAIDVPPAVGDVPPAEALNPK